VFGKQKLKRGRAACGIRRWRALFHDIAVIDEISGKGSRIEFDVGTYAIDRGRLIPSFCMRDCRVLGCKPSTVAAPFSPEMTHPIPSSTRRM
jgi:hypothetical protein